MAITKWTVDVDDEALAAGVNAENLRRIANNAKRLAEARRIDPDAPAPTPVPMISMQEMLQQWVDNGNSRWQVEAQQELMEAFSRLDLTERRRALGR